LDDYSQYIFIKRPAASLGAEEIKCNLWPSLDSVDLETGLLAFRHPLISNNSPAYLSRDLARFLHRKQMDHVRGAPYHPMTQGKIERWHRSMKNVVRLENYYSPSDQEAAIAEFVDYYNHGRYHEALDNLTPADTFFRRAKEVMDRRKEIKRRTL